MQQTKAPNGTSPQNGIASSGSGAADTKLPLFYTAPQRLDSRRHAGKRLAQATKFDFAKATNSIPLNGIEFLLAVKNYPIVFTATDPALPVAVVGLRDRENLYVRADGSWESGAYIPAYVRRYPFIFLEDRERGQFVLCIDENSENLSDSEGELLFDGDQPGPAGTRGRDFCTAFQGQVQATRAFADAVAAAGLLVENRAQVVL